MLLHTSATDVSPLGVTRRSLSLGEPRNRTVTRGMSLPTASHYAVPPQEELPHHAGAGLEGRSSVPPFASDAPQSYSLTPPVKYIALWTPALSVQ